MIIITTYLFCCVPNDARVPEATLLTFRRTDSYLRLCPRQGCRLVASGTFESDLFRIHSLPHGKKMNNGDFKKGT